MPFDYEKMKLLTGIVFLFAAVLHAIAFSLKKIFQFLHFFFLEKENGK